MNIKLSVITLSIFVLISCDFRKSVNTDLVTGLTTRGDGLSCDNVYLSDGVQKLSRNSFTYGEKFYLNFENIEGFIKQENNVFPGLELLIVGQVGDTIMYNADLYANNVDGFDISPLLLQANVTAGSPIHSGNEYTLHTKIWDKKGNGIYKSELDFDIASNSKIEVVSTSVSYDEIYLFSQERKTTITDDNAKFNENVFLIFEGLEGFMQENGKVSIGLSVKAIDSAGEIILSEEDLVGESGMELSEFKSQIAPNFIFKDSSIKNPVTCEIVIWDKKSESRIEASVKLNLK